MENKQLNNEVKFGVKSFISTCAILLAVMITVGILTFAIPAGSYQADDTGKIIPDSFTFLSESTRLPVYRWFTAPVEALLIGEGNTKLGAGEENFMLYNGQEQTIGLAVRVNFVESVYSVPAVFTGALLVLLAFTPAGGKEAAKHG